MKNYLYDHGYGVEWNERYVYSREGYMTSVLDFHEHDFYEVNLILSGNVRILFPDRFYDETESCLVLSRPGTSHFIACQPDTLYSRLYLCFSHEFVADFSLETHKLLNVFAKNGTLIHLSEEQREDCHAMIQQIGDEKDRLRQKLLIFLLLSRLNDYVGNSSPSFVGIPPYVINTLTYIDEHFSEKITAETLAKKLNIGRTTLMTGFKRYTGNTLNDYLANVRLRNAIHLLREGLTVQETADRCGFGDSSNFIRSFKKAFGSPPRKYLLKFQDAR